MLAELQEGDEKDEAEEEVSTSLPPMPEARGETECLFASLLSDKRIRVGV